VGAESTPDPRDPRLTLGRFLADVAARHAERRAVHFEGREWSYRELEREARALARGLVGAGLVKGARVALLLANRPEWIAATYAVGTIGGVVVPLNTFASRQELAYVLRHGDASVLLMQRSLLRHAFLDDLLADHPEIARGSPGALRVPALPQLRAVFCLGIERARGGVLPWAELLARGVGVGDELVGALCSQVEPSDDALVIYTSGTTAHPKGVLHAHRAAVLQGRRFAELLRFGPEERVFTTYPFFWTAGIAMSIGATLAAGGCLLLQESFEPGAALELVERERATAIHAWPHQGKAMAEHPDAARRDLASVRKLDFASPLAELAGIEKDGYGTGASYGLSETFTIASMLPADSPPELRRATHGRALPGTELRIVDPETGAPVPAGEPGEIAVRGATLMRGYHKVLPELAFDADGWLRTQDGGSLDAEGFLHWTGRLSNLIKTGGANVSPLEIEAALASHPDLRVAVAVGVGHPTLGEAIVLCAVPAEGRSLDEAAIRRFLRERLAAYKVPKRVLAFHADELAYTGNQKVQLEPLRRLALARLAAEGAEIEGHRFG
jgi:acyl-CoA synthetase (AMP-forming)/AMP-acid ligase II